MINTDTWEQRKLGDTVQITMGQSPDGSTYSETPSDYILVQGNADLKDGWVSPRVWTSQMTKKADAGDLIMSVRAPAGAMGKTAYNAVIGRGVAAIKGNEFIYQSLVKMDSNGYWKKLSNGSTFESLNSNNIKDAEIFVPCDEEQQKIGQYFSNLDNLITLHQRKLFLNFAKRNDWEQRKLGEVSDVRDGTHDSPKYQSIGHPFVTSKNVKNGYITYDDIQYISDEDFAEINKRSKVDINDILMGMIGTIGNMALIRTEPDFAIKNVALIKDTKQINYLYLYHLLQSPFIEKQLTSGMDGGTQKFVSLGNVRNLNVIYPSDIEQDKIGCYFEKLDHLITLHRRAYYNKKGGLTNVHNDNQQHYAIL